jgi:hypothetical protein
MCVVPAQSNYTIFDGGRRSGDRCDGGEEAGVEEGERQLYSREFCEFYFRFFPLCSLVGAEVGLVALLRHRLPVRLHEPQLRAVGGQALATRVSPPSTHRYFR